MAATRALLAAVLAALALTCVILVFDNEGASLGIVREEGDAATDDITDPVGKAQEAQTLKDFAVMGKAQEAAKAIGGDAYNTAVEDCRTLRKAAAVECGKAYCEAGDSCDEPCPDLYGNPPVQVSVRSSTSRV